MSSGLLKANAKVQSAVAELDPLDAEIVLEHALKNVRSLRESISTMRAATRIESADERRKRMDRERKAAKRSADTSGHDADNSADVPGDDADNSGSVRTDSASPRAPSLSDLSDLDLSLSQQNPRGNVTSAPGARDGVVTPIDADAPLPDEWRDASRMLGVRDPESAWLSFRGHHVAKGTTTTAAGWRALFVDKWCVRERGYQARDAANGRGRGKELQRPAEVPTWEMPEEAKGP